MAYKALLKKFHPDRNPGCEKSHRITQAINASFEVLKDPDRRRAHDEWIEETEAELRRQTAKQYRETSSFRQSPPPVPPSPPPAPPTPPPVPTDSATSKKDGGLRFGCILPIAVAFGIFWVLLWNGIAPDTSDSSHAQSQASPAPWTPPEKDRIVSETGEMPTLPALSSSTSVGSTVRSFANDSSAAVFDKPALPLPPHGEMVAKPGYTLVAPFEIRTQSGANYLVKLTEARTGEDVMTVFVRGGQSLDIKAPLGRFLIKYAAGSEWYGDRDLFGSNTQYFKADDIFEFTRSISPQAQSRLDRLNRYRDQADASLRAYLVRKGLPEATATKMFEGVDPDTGESGIGRLPASYWTKFLGQVTNVQVRNQIVELLNARNRFQNEIIGIRNTEEKIEGYVVTLYKVANGNLETEAIRPEDF